MQSKKSQKSIKCINASLERIHTFGMSNLHKNKLDTEKKDKSYESIFDMKATN